MTEDVTSQNPTRRDFLYPLTAGSVLVTIGAGLSGLASSTISRPTAPWPLKIDLGAIPEGAEVVVKYQGRPLTVRHRTAKEIAAAEAIDPDILIDPLAQNSNLDPKAPATDQNRRATQDGRFLVTVPICTHMGCVLLGNGVGDFGGSFCSCHGAYFDTAGRVRKAPATRNLPIPPLMVRNDMILEVYGPEKS